jgi:hypothetical protein
MELVPFAEIEYRYTSMNRVDYGVGGGQFYGVMEGTLRGERLEGRVHLTNLATNRSDDVNTPTLRGLLTTSDGATVWSELDGLAVMTSGARAFVTSARFRTSAPGYTWLNTLFFVVEGVLDTETLVASGQMFECRHALATTR